MLIAYPGSTDNSATIGSIKAIVFLLSLYEADICPIVLHSTRLVTGQRSPLGHHSSITKILPIPPGRGTLAFFSSSGFFFLVVRVTTLGIRTTALTYYFGYSLPDTSAHLPSWVKLTKRRKERKKGTKSQSTPKSAIK